MPKARLTSRFVAKLNCPEGLRKTEYVDTALEGFFVEALQSGVKTYYQRYTDLHGKQRQFRIGRVGVVPFEEARKRAIQVKADISLGRDPRQELKLVRDVPTLREFALNSYLPFVEQKKRSWKTDEVLIRRHLLPALGAVYLDDITTTLVVRMMASMRAAGFAPGTCNRPVIILRYMLNLARKWGIPRMERNPATDVELYEEQGRERFLSQDETEALMQSIREDENRVAATAIELLLLTGARRNEVTQAKWDYVDFEKKTLFVPLSKSGKPRFIALNEPALQLLSTWKAQAKNDWVFPSDRTDRPCPALFYPWDRIRKRAGLPDVRLHDLRHSYASFLVNNGVSIYVVQQLLGHTQTRTTQRYSHLDRDTLNDAAAVAGAVVRKASGI
jgi:integrase